MNLVPAIGPNASGEHLAWRLNARTAEHQKEVALYAIRESGGKYVNFWFRDENEKVIGFQVSRSVMGDIFQDLYPRGE